MVKVLAVIVLLIAGLILGIQIRSMLRQSTRKKIRKNIASAIDDSITDRVSIDYETWNIVTDYGKYPEIWEIYRHKGLLEAIKSRDEKIKFDLKVSQIKSPNQSNTSHPIPENIAQSINEPVQNDRETWNIVTDYGKYPKIWQIYRHKGWLEAIKSRDEKIKFDLKASQIKSSNQSDICYPQPKQNSQPIQENINPIFNNNIDTKLDELDLALLKNIEYYFEIMPNKIRHYHRDHQASKEEAEVIANYYIKTAGMIKKVKTQQDLKQLIEFGETLKEKVSRYNHKSYKYRWTTGLEKEVLVKLRKILP